MRSSQWLIRMSTSLMHHNSLFTPPQNEFPFGFSPKISSNLIGWFPTLKIRKYFLKIWANTPRNSLLLLNMLEDLLYINRCLNILTDISGSWRTDSQVCTYKWIRWSQKRIRLLDLHQTPQWQDLSFIESLRHIIIAKNSEKRYLKHRCKFRLQLSRTLANRFFNVL